ncbi:MAG TPA: NAD-dependent dehydratase, partial [Parachlamydiales bacterium]|nr:NAD-dependent dehydratase [Parachlamydiales bacterium]
IFNTYGPRMDRDDGRVVSNLILQALRNEPLTIYGEGSQTRSFCYVDDLVESLILFMETDDALLGPLNLGNPDEFTILELAELILEFTGSSSKLLFSPLPSDDPKKRRPDITLAQDLLSWEPKVSLREGLKATLAYFRT